MIQIHSLLTDQVDAILLTDRLPLRSFVIKQPIVSPKWMENFLKHTPNLEELQLISIYSIDGNKWGWPQFSRHLQELSLPLKRFHYSVQFMLLADDEEEKEIFVTCPTARERTFLTSKMTPSIIKCLMDQPFALTTLEITFDDQTRISASHQATRPKRGTSSFANARVFNISKPSKYPTPPIFWTFTGAFTPIRHQGVKSIRVRTKTNTS
ncbi:hypothetical protein BGZ95_000950 [Linnemannia exigua]|uniref:Uncharacterized protein n=1 Tax=Linnemannia exigua TaxID=604196 RepID=A0AAD4H9V4_9FUNG|nr:hypothetical protein BGZ95_000950 [Linnemannia exigua]